MIEKAKNIVWVVMVIFSVCAFIQTLLTLNPRLTKVEERATKFEDRLGVCESKVSGIEFKLDAILKQNSEASKDIKDIYHLIMERHK